MPTTFQRLWEDAQRHKQGRDFWQGGSHGVEPETDESAKQMVQRGLELRPDREDGKTFWDDFIEVMTTNSEGASKLLGVGQDVIARWPKTIRQILDKVRQENDNGGDDRSDKKQMNMVQTGA